MNKKVALLLVPLLCGSTNLSAEPITPEVMKYIAEPKHSKTIRDDENGFELSIPESWEQRSDIKIPGVALIVQAEAENKVGNCNIRSKPIATSTKKDKKNEFWSENDASELMKSYEASGISPEDFVHSTISINNRTALYVEFSFKTSTADYRTFNVLIAEGNKIFTIGCTDIKGEFHESLAEFGVLLSSFMPLTIK